MATSFSSESLNELASAGVLRLSLPDGSASPTGAAFIAGPENETVSAVVAAFLKPGVCEYSPLVIHGASGTGKSRLARGLFQAWQDENGEEGGEYLAAIDLVNEDVAPVVASQARFLVVEDLLQIAEKPAHQALLSRRLDAVEESPGRAIITSRVPPREIGSLSLALRSRLSAGLNLPLAPPGIEARIALLEVIAGERGVVITPPALATLAQAVGGTAPELIGAVMALQAATADREIEPADVRIFLAGKTPQRGPSLAEIAQKTAKAFSLKVSDLKSDSRRQSIVRARGVAMVLARRLTRLSFEQIGAYFGGRDHTTVLHGCRKTEEWLAEDPGVRHTLQELREALVFE